MTYLVEVRRTLEWGGYYEAADEAAAKKAAALDLTFEHADIVDEQVICKRVNMGQEEDDAG